MNGFNDKPVVAGEIEEALAFSRRTQLREDVLSSLLSEVSIQLDNEVR